MQSPTDTQEPNMSQVKDFQQVVTAEQLQAGDYVYESRPMPYTGPRGGRYIVRPVRIMARVQSFDSRTGTLLLSDAGRAEFPLRLRYKDVEMVIKKRDSEGGSQLPSSEQLLQRAAQAEAFGNTYEAERLLAEAEAAEAAGR